MWLAGSNSVSARHLGCSAVGGVPCWAGLPRERWRHWCSWAGHSWVLEVAGIPLILSLWTSLSLTRPGHKQSNSHHTVSLPGASTEHPMTVKSSYSQREVQSAKIPRPVQSCTEDLRTPLMTKEQVSSRKGDSLQISPGCLALAEGWREGVVQGRKQETRTVPHGWSPAGQVVGHSKGVSF